MKIGTDSTRFNTEPRTASAATPSGDGISFAAALEEATSAIAKNSDKAGTQHTDFTSMTRKDLFDWMNTQLRSGQMSFEESTPFLNMSMRIPVNAGSSTPTPINDTERVDFIQLARAGIADAQQRHDDITQGMLSSALSIMQRRQGEAAGVDARV